MLTNPYFLTIIALVSWILTAYCTFKTRQSEGKEFVNDLSTDLGGGSFFDSLMNPIRKAMWSILGFLAFLSAIAFSAMAFNGGSSADKSTTPPAEKANAPSISQPEKRESTESSDQKIEQKPPPTKAEAIVEEADKKSDVQKNNIENSLTEEEVKKLEIEKGYSGNDPIIRQRLGLPPKNVN